MELPHSELGRHSTVSHVSTQLTILVRLFYLAPKQFHSKPKSLGKIADSLFDPRGPASIKGHTKAYAADRLEVILFGTLAAGH